MEPNTKSNNNSQQPVLTMSRSAGVIINSSGRTDPPRDSIPLHDSHTTNENDDDDDDLNNLTITISSQIKNYSQKHLDRIQILEKELKSCQQNLELKTQQYAELKNQLVKFRDGVNDWMKAVSPILEKKAGLKVEQFLPDLDAFIIQKKRSLRSSSFLPTISSFSNHNDNNDNDSGNVDTSTTTTTTTTTTIKPQGEAIVNNHAEAVSNVKRRRKKYKHHLNLNSNSNSNKSRSAHTLNSSTSISDYAPTTKASSSSSAGKNVSFNETIETLKTSSEDKQAEGDLMGHSDNDGVVDDTVDGAGHEVIRKVETYSSPVIVEVDDTSSVPMHLPLDSSDDRQFDHMLLPPTKSLLAQDTTTTTLTRNNNNQTRRVIRNPYKKSQKSLPASCKKNILIITTKFLLICIYKLDSREFQKILALSSTTFIVLLFAE